MRRYLVTLCFACACVTSPPKPTAATPSPAPEVKDPLEQLRVDAKALKPLVTSTLAVSFLDATAALTPPAPRELLANPKSGKVFTKARAATLNEGERSALEPVSESDVATFFYNTYHGTPLAYARAVDLLGTDGLTAAPGRRLADFGFGNIGQLRLLAALGFSATGVDVNPTLGDLYAAPGDQGPFGSGEVKVLIGKYPLEPALKDGVGDGLDVFLSKNVLKKGYIHPDRAPGKPEWVIQLGVSDDVFLKTIHDALKHGGRFLIYNICPAPTPEGEPFVTWTDGRSPFTKEQFAASGFRVKAFDVDDTAYIRQLGHVLRWDAGEEKMDLEHDLSVLYTLVERAD